VTPNLARQQAKNRPSRGVAAQPHHRLAMLLCRAELEAIKAGEIDLALRGGSGRGCAPGR